MLQEPSHVKQLSPIHVCKIGLKQDERKKEQMEEGIRREEKE
jgi:hypothetical protein